MNLLLVVGIGFVLLVLGTILGRYYTPDRRPLERAAEEGMSYLRGLVEVLEGNDDEAISQIAGALKRNTRTVEAYFALGTLFRNRGEHERAVRVHQSLLMRRDLDKRARNRVLRQLALDFREAGFPNRAVKALQWAASQDKKNPELWRELVRQYEQAAQWERAALACRRLQRLVPGERQELTGLQAHLWATQAAEQLEAGELEAARRSLKRAVSASSESVHVLHVLARFHKRRGNLKAAAAAWDKAIRQAPDLVSFFFPSLEQCLFELGRMDAAERLLHQLGSAHPDNVHLRLTQARSVARRSPGQALSALSALLEEHPHLLPARREAARLVLKEGDPERVRRALSDLLSILERADRGFRCGSCGHAGEDLFWRCPQCGAWGSVLVAWGRRAGERPKRDP